jgi:hypothetical protein
MFEIFNIQKSAAEWTDQFHDFPVPPHPPPPLQRARDKTAKAVVRLMHDGAPNRKRMSILFHNHFQNSSQKHTKTKNNKIDDPIKRNQNLKEEKKTNTSNYEKTPKLHLQLQFSTDIFKIVATKKCCPQILQ